MQYLFFVIIGYMMGSILFGKVIPRVVKGIDIAAVSSDGNPGAANAFVHAGKGCGLLVLLCDLLKGAVPVFIAARYLNVDSLYFAPVLVAPVVGHAFPLYSGTKGGGKCIAVSFGVLLGLWPSLSHVLLLAAWFIALSVLVVVRPHAHRTVAAFLGWILCEGILFGKGALLPGFIAIAAIVSARHAPQISRQAEERTIQLTFLKEKP